MAHAGIAHAALRSEFGSLAEVRRALEAKLTESALGLGDAKLLGFQPYTATECAATFPDLPAYRAGFYIPYYDFEHQPTDFYRYRYLEYGHASGFAALVKDQIKQLRYGQPKDSINQIYLPPTIDWPSIIEDPDQPIIITEGELKAACAAKYGYTCMALGGVWCFRSVNSHVTLLPQFTAINWQGRHVYICYDSDAASNFQVVKAESALAQELLNLGARPRIIRLPTLAPPKKTGLDDLLAQGHQAIFDDLVAKSVEFAAAWELHQLNQEVTYVQNPGLVLRLDSLQRLSCSAFTDHAYANRIYHKEVAMAKGMARQEVSAAREWIKWPSRSIVKAIAYEPGTEQGLTEDGSYNIWGGWGCEPAPGNVKPWRELLDFLFTGSKPESRQWFEQWLAYPLQHPGEKLFSASLIWGIHQGTGKSLVGYTMFKIYGDNATEIGDKDLYSDHNEWAENKQFVMADEITSSEKKRNIGDRMKSLITQKQLRLNPKYIPSYTIPDRINYYFTSNHPDAFYIEDTDRRFFVHEVRSAPLAPEFYSNYGEWLNNSGPSHLFHYLLKLDTSNFNPKGHAPRGPSKADMISLGRSDVATWVADLRDDPDRVLIVGNAPVQRKLWTSTELHNLYDPMKTGKVTVNGLARELRRAGFKQAYDGMPISTKTAGNQKLWAIRDIDAVLKLRGPALADLYDKECGNPKGRKF